MVERKRPSIARKLKEDASAPAVDDAAVPAVDDAAAIPEVFITAWDALVVQGGLTSGRWALVHAGASGVGTAAIQIAKAAGARVIAAASSAEKCALCQKVGADETIDYSVHTPQAGLRDAIKAAKELAQTEEAELVQIPALHSGRENFFQQLLSEDEDSPLFAKASADPAREFLQANAKWLRSLRALNDPKGVYLTCPLIPERR
mgnify:CR=1 FL=1